MANATKDTIYIEVDDEITAIIDKVVNAKHKVVAVVLPKRATVFQSPVNLKLLKKASTSAKKSIVLITSDTGIIAIAGSVGVHVAKSPTSKPSIPPSVVASMVVAENIDMDGNETVAGVTGVANISDDDTIEIDNTDSTTEPEIAEPTKKKKVSKIPDFSSFRLRLGLGIGAVVILISLWYVGFVVLPKATVTITTDVSTTEVSTTLTARVGDAELDLDKNIIPASRVQIEKVESVTVPATGEKNIGAKATGTINLTNCIKSDGVQVVPAGTRFSSSGVTFETSEQAILPEASFRPSGACKSKDDGDDLTVSAVAVDPGTQSNIDSQTLNSSISGIIAVGSDMNGGTSEKVKVVSQEDVDKVAQQLAGTTKSQALTELEKQLKDDGKRPISETIVAGVPKVVASPAVGAQASETKVTSTVSYSLLGVKGDDLAKLIDNQVNKNLGDKAINIRYNGINEVVFATTGALNQADTGLTIQTIATVGPEINQDETKNNIIGKKRGDIEKQIEAIDGVRSVSVEYSPFWISTTPNKVDKITIVFVEDNDNQ